MQSLETLDIRVPKLVVIYELILGICEVLGGVLIAIFNKKILLLYNNVRLTDWLESSNFLLAKFLDRLKDALGPNIFSHKDIIIGLLFLFGVSKIVSSIGLLHEREWAGHLLIVILVILIPFEFVSLALKLSISRLSYLVIDILILFYLVKFKPVHYYKKVRKYINKDNKS